jgi:hypothetical protein
VAETMRGLAPAETSRAGVRWRVGMATSQIGGFPLRCPTLLAVIAAVILANAGDVPEGPRTLLELPGEVALFTHR